MEEKTMAVQDFIQNTESIIMLHSSLIQMAIV